MLRIGAVTFCCWLIGLVAAVWSGEFNKKLNIGDPAPVWKELPGTDGKTHGLTDLAKKEVVVVIFTCNSCPVAVDYEERIIALAKKHGGTDSKVAFVAINVNKIPADSLDMMKVRAKDRGFNFPYLFDASQKIARDFGATYTPEFFVLDKERKVAYMGALDDRNKASDAKVNYLDAAISALLSGKKPSPQETLARGCRIRFEREKR